MMEREISFLEQNAEGFERVEEKNQFIQSSDTEWIGFADGTVAGRDEIFRILEENPFLMDYDVIIFGDDVPEGECNHLQILTHPGCTVFAFLFRKRNLVNTGSFNRLLTGNSNYEFLLRLAEKSKVYAIPCSANKSAKFYPETMAYIVRHYMEDLKEKDALDEVLVGFVQEARQAGKLDAFKDWVNSFLADSEEYVKIAADTAPCLIVVSDDLSYYGVVDGFANYLADEMVALGQAVLTTNGRYGDYHCLSTSQFLQQTYKAIIGFQASVLQAESFRDMKGRRYQFWLDDPMYKIEFLGKAPKETRILCQDANYAKFLRVHLGLEYAIQFPPAGVKCDYDFQDRQYDLVFIGSYISAKEMYYSDDFQRMFVEFMLRHPTMTVEQGVRHVWQECGILYDEDNFMRTISELKPLCQGLLHILRHRVVETILCSGIQLHVFGESWKAYCGVGMENLIIHPKVMVNESLKIFSQAKIGLNIMNGHKAGMTERIANIMLNGACCISDETGYLREHFRDGEEIVLFSMDELELLPEKIKFLLQHEEEREKIALAGQVNALQKHTWRIRAEELLEKIEKDLMGAK